MELTEAGAAFLPGARACLESAERAAIEAAAAAGEVRGRLVIGVIPTVTALDIPAALREFHRVHPAVAISLRGGGSDELVAGIGAGDVDVAVLGLPETVLPQRVRFRELARDRLVAVCSVDHRLARRKRLALADLDEEVFADFPAGTPGRAQSDLAFGGAGLHREVAFEAMATELILGLIEENLAIALLPPAFVRPRTSLVSIPVTDGPTRVEYLAWSDFNPSPPARVFLDSLHSSGPGGAPVS